MRKIILAMVVLFVASVLPATKLLARDFSQVRGVELKWDLFDHYKKKRINPRFDIHIWEGPIYGLIKRQGSSGGDARGKSFDVLVVGIPKGQDYQIGGQFGGPEDEMIRIHGNYQINHNDIVVEMELDSKVEGTLIMRGVLRTDGSRPKIQFVKGYQKISFSGSVDRPKPKSMGAKNTGYWGG